MKHLRRLLGLFVIVAGVIGLLISLTGLVGVWVLKPRITAALTTTVDLLLSSVGTSQQALTSAEVALEAGITSVEELADMLANTSTTLADTQPVITQLTDVMGEQLPETMQAATDSLKTTESIAESLEGVIKSFQTFRNLLANIPLVGTAIPPQDDTYDPDKTLADSLGELSDSIAGIPAIFSDISTDIDQASGNLDLIKGNLDTMSESVGLISDSLTDYKGMIADSKATMSELESMLADLQHNLKTIITISVIGMWLFFLWLLAAQVVLLSQGWELFHGTAVHVRELIEENPQQKQQTEVPADHLPTADKPEETPTQSQAQEPEA
jgi:uncharacterized phage infection (PIP) family protein YhgE